MPTDLTESLAVLMSLKGRIDLTVSMNLTGCISLTWWMSPTVWMSLTACISLIMRMSLKVWMSLTVWMSMIVRISLTRYRESYHMLWADWLRRVSRAMSWVCARNELTGYGESHGLWAECVPANSEPYPLKEAAIGGYLRGKTGVRVWNECNKCSY
jgi:hypothetical protein